MEEKKIKVTDKRMFTPDGELREEYRSSIEETPEPTPEVEQATSREEVSQKESTDPESQPEPAAPAGEPSTEGSIGERSAGVEIPDMGPGAKKPEFADLVALLAQPIAMYLGDVPLPDGESAENLDLARLYIDMLEVLQTKTKGNLSAQELSFLDDLLYQIRLRYVQKRG